MLKPLGGYLAKCMINIKDDILQLKQIHERQEFKCEKSSFVIAITVI